MARYSDAIPNTSWMNYSEPVSSAGGFTGSPNIGGSSGGGGFNMNQMGGFLGLANLGLNALGMSNASASANQFQQTAGLMGDIAFGRDLYALNKDIAEQKDAARWASKFQVNDPFYRQNQSRAYLGDIAGKYGGTAFGSFAGQ